MSDPLWAPTTPVPTPSSEASDRPPHRTGDALREVAVCLGVLLVLAVICGVLWSRLAPSPEFTKFRTDSSMGEDQLSLRFAADAWYSVVAAVAGLLSGTVLSWWRDRDPLLTSAVLLAGSAAAGGVMSWVGHRLGPGNPSAALAAAKVGAHVPDQLVLSSHTAYVVWPLGALLGALIVLFGRPAVSDT